MINVSVSNTLDSADTKHIKNSISEFSKLIADTAIFNKNENKEDIENLLVEILEDLYVTEPQEVINFVNQQPTKKFIINLFLQFGIDPRYFSKIPEMLRTRTAYLLSQLFETKGSNKTFSFFNDIISEFYHNLNFYNLQIEQRVITNKYQNVYAERFHYIDNDKTALDSYQLSEQEAQSFKDSDIHFKIFTKTYSIYHRVEYKLKFYPEEYDGSQGIEWKLPHAVKVRLNHSDDLIVPRGATEFVIKLPKYDITDEYSIRNDGEINYKLEPVLINDDKSIITTINPGDLRTSKYLMRSDDFFDTDIWNTEAKNVFPIITNVLFIQFATSDTMDTMKYYPDLVRMFAMTSMQDKTFSFQIGKQLLKLPIAEYMNVLTFIKLKELQFSNPGWKYGDHEFAGTKYGSFIFPKSRLEEIYKLILFYQDMPHDHDIFQDFKRRLNVLTDDINQVQSTKIFNIEQFTEYLSGNIPETFALFELKMNDFYPDGVNIIAGHDQNKLMKEKVLLIKEHYSPTTTQELFNLIAIHDKEYLGLNNSLYDMLKENFVSKYPRMVQAIEAIDTRTGFTELYLDNYKRMLVETKKMDDLVTYFVNDTFKRFIMDGTFKEEFFDPMLNLFQKYFFKAELSYQNSDAILTVIRDKMQQVTVGDNLGTTSDSDRFDEITLTDKHTIRITDSVTDETITFKEDEDVVYKPR